MKSIKSGPSDKEALDTIELCMGRMNVISNVVQRDKQMEDDSYPIHVRVNCNDGTKGSTDIPL